MCLRKGLGAQDGPSPQPLVGSWRLAGAEKSFTQLLPFSATGVVSHADWEPWAVGNRSSYLKVTSGISFMYRGSSEARAGLILAGLTSQG